MTCRQRAITAPIDVDDSAPEDNERVVVAIPVDVVQRHRDRPAPPLGQPAFLAPILLQPQRDQAPLQVRTVSRGAEQLLDRHGLRARADLAPRHGVGEALARHPEAPLALSDAVALVVVRLYRSPVVPPAHSLVARDAEPAAVVRDRGLRDAEPPRDLRGDQPFGEELGHPLSCR